MLTAHYILLQKGDGNGSPSAKWPNPVKTIDGEDPWDYLNSPLGVPQNDVVGRVVMRIPWFGWVALIMQQSSWGLPLIIALIILLIVVEFVVPILRGKKEKTEKQRIAQQTLNLCK